jgi:rhodanese-related sulfurtransferase
MTTANPSLQLDTAALRELLAAGPEVRVLDVRTPAEFESAHLPGSVNVPLDTLREHRDEIARHLRQPVVLICRSGQRAAQAERLLADAGLPDVQVLVGGILAWERAGARVVRGRARWELERQVRLLAGSLVLLGILASTAVPALKWFSAAIGTGLVVAALTNTCAMGMALARLPYNRGARSGLDTVVAQLTRRV